MQLHVFMAYNNLRDEDVARKIRRSRVAVNRWRRQIQRPDWAAIKALRKFSEGKVTAADFEDLQPNAEAAE
jgi:hypothetical protein